MKKDNIKNKVKVVTGAVALSLYLTSCGNSDDVKMDTEDNKEVVTYLDEEEYISKFNRLKDKMGPNVSKNTFEDTGELYISNDMKDYLHNISAQASATSEEAKEIYQQRLDESESKEELETNVTKKLLVDYGMNFEEWNNLDGLEVFYKEDILHLTWTNYVHYEEKDNLDYDSGEQQIRNITDRNHYSFVVADSSLDNVSEFLFATDENSNCNFEMLEEDYYKVMSSDYQFECGSSSKETYYNKCDNNIIDMPSYVNIYDVEKRNNYIGVVYNEKNMENLQSYVINEGINTIKSSYVYDDKDFNDFRISKATDGSWIISENDLLIGELTSEQSYLCNFIGDLQGEKKNSESNEFNTSIGVVKLLEEIDNYKILTNDDSLGHGNSR